MGHLVSSPQLSRAFLWKSPIQCQCPYCLRHLLPTKERAAERIGLEGGPGMCQALAVSHEFDWPPFSGSLLSDFVLFLRSVASPWAPAGVSYQQEVPGILFPLNILSRSMGPTCDSFPLLAPLSCWPLTQDACPAQPRRAKGGLSPKPLPASPALFPSFPATVANGSCHLCCVLAPSHFLSHTRLYDSS